MKLFVLKYGGYGLHSPYVLLAAHGLAEARQFTAIVIEALLSEAEPSGPLKQPQVKFQILIYAKLLSEKNSILHYP